MQSSGNKKIQNNLFQERTVTVLASRVEIDSVLFLDLVKISIK